MKYRRVEDRRGTDPVRAVGSISSIPNPGGA
jgi:hypothetical protein